MRSGASDAPGDLHPGECAARGGCSCAGPYGHRLLGIDMERSQSIGREIGRGSEGIKPGWVRVNFNYFFDDETFEYILSAVEIVAEHGARLLRRYKLFPDSALWRQRGGIASSSLSLDDISYESGAMAFRPRADSCAQLSLPEHLERTRELIAELCAFSELAVD